jgi:flagellar motor switch/type III secretory pathway protein FliN
MCWRRRPVFLLLSRLLLSEELLSHAGLLLLISNLFLIIEAIVLTIEALVGSSMLNLEELLEMGVGSV